MLKVYIDTNVWIRGPKEPEHDRLKELSKNKQIVLFHSIHGNIEQSAKTMLIKKRMDLINLYKSREEFNRFINERNEYNKTLETENAENHYWSDAVLTHAISSFGTLFSNFYAYQSRLLPDRNREIDLLQNLLEKHKIDFKDAVHAMYAHSMKMDYLLTWDKKFIKKCRGVDWLKFKITTPKEFLLTI